MSSIRGTVLSNRPAQVTGVPGWPAVIRDTERPAVEKRVPCLASGATEGTRRLSVETVL